MNGPQSNQLVAEDEGVIGPDARQDRNFQILIALLIVASVLASFPVLEMGMNDDWSYTFMARDLARTGHLHYVGWASAIVGLQAWWAALWIRLFGFSFTLVRLTTLPFAAGCGVLIYRLGRYAGLKPSLAFFGSVTLTLSPLFVPLAASFMTDVPGDFFWLACIYCALEAARSKSPGSAMKWVGAATALGLAGGSVRQTVFFVPLLEIPLVAWVRRKERASVVVCVGCWCASAILALLAVLWFQRQPYIQIQAYASSVGDLLAPLDLVGYSLAIAVSIATFVLPILLLSVAELREGFPKPWALAVAAALAVVGGLVWLNTSPRMFLMGNIVGRSGILSTGTDTLGLKPVVLPPDVIRFLEAFVFAGVTLTLAYMLNDLRRNGTFRNPSLNKPGFHPLQGLRSLALRADRSAPNAFYLFFFFYAPLSALYLGALIYRAQDSSLMFDRYLLPILPLIAIALLRYYQHHGYHHAAWIGWGAAAVFLLYGISSTHDAFAASRARLRAASAIASSGVPRERISAGLEYDGWTELEHSGYINTEDLRPESAYHSQEGREYAYEPPYWFWEYTPSLNPSYFVTETRIRALEDAPFPPVQYRTWLPPYDRQFFSQKAPDAH